MFIIHSIALDNQIRHALGRRLFPTGRVGRAGSSTAWRLSAAAEGARWRVADVRLRKIDSLATACRPRPAALRPKAAFSEASVAADGILGALVGGDYVLDESVARDVALGECHEADALDGCEDAPSFL